MADLSNYRNIGIFAHVDAGTCEIIDRLEVLDQLVRLHLLDIMLVRAVLLPNAR